MRESRPYGSVRGHRWCDHQRSRQLMHLNRRPAWVSLFDHLVGAGEQCRRHGKAERLGRFEVDDQLILGRRPHWQIGQVRLLNAFALD
jgi:hypothetical protein